VAAGLNHDEDAAAIHYEVKVLFLRPPAGCLGDCDSLGRVESLKTDLAPTLPPPTGIGQQKQHFSTQPRTNVRTVTQRKLRGF